MSPAPVLGSAVGSACRGVNLSWGQPPLLTASSRLSCSAAGGRWAAHRRSAGGRSVVGRRSDGGQTAVSRRSVGGRSAVASAVGRGRSAAIESCSAAGGPMGAGGSSSRSDNLSCVYQVCRHSESSHLVTWSYRAWSSFQKKAAVGWYSIVFLSVFGHAF